jgi:hypothetical protein
MMLAQQRNPAMTPDYFDKLVTQTERDLGMQLVCNERSTPDVIETNETWNGNTIGYHTKNVSRMSVEAQGFVWHHPHGAIIRGNFASPIVLATAVVDEDGGELDGDSFEQKVAQGILGKLGPIACLDEINY